MTSDDGRRRASSSFASSDVIVSTNDGARAPCAATIDAPFASARGRNGARFRLDASEIIRRSLITTSFDEYNAKQHSTTALASPRGAARAVYEGDVLRKPSASRRQNIRLCERSPLERLRDDGGDGVDGGVVNLDVVLLVVERGRGDSLTRHHGDLRRHVRRGERALGDVVQDDVLEAVVGHDFNLGQALRLAEIGERVIVRREHGDRALAREFSLNAGLRFVNALSQSRASSSRLLFRVFRHAPTAPPHRARAPGSRPRDGAAVPRARSNRREIIFPFVRALARARARPRARATTPHAMPRASIAYPHAVARARVFRRRTLVIAAPKREYDAALAIIPNASLLYARCAIRIDPPSSVARASRRRRRHRRGNHHHRASRRRRRRGRTAPSSPPLELRRTMELPRLATVCLVVATALAETVNFWASMANVCVKECGATRARDGADDVRSRVRSRPIVALEMLSDPCVRARVVKKYRPPNPTSWRTECAYACGYRRMSERRVAPARANAPNAPRAAERARRRTRALPRRERARVE